MYSYSCLLNVLYTFLVFQVPSNMSIQTSEKYALNRNSVQRFQKALRPYINLAQCDDSFLRLVYNVELKSTYDTRVHYAVVCVNEDTLLTRGIVGMNERLWKSHEIVYVNRKMHTYSAPTLSAFVPRV